MFTNKIECREYLNKVLPNIVLGKEDIDELDNWEDIKTFVINSIILYQPDFGQENMNKFGICDFQKENIFLAVKRYVLF